MDQWRDVELYPLKAFLALISMIESNNKIAPHFAQWIIWLLNQFLKGYIMEILSEKQTFPMLFLILTITYIQEGSLFFISF